MGKVPLRTYRTHPSKTRLKGKQGFAPAPHSLFEKKRAKNFTLPSAEIILVFRKNAVFANEGPGKSFPWQGFGDRIPEKKEIPKEISFGIIFIWEIIL